MQRKPGMFRDRGEAIDRLLTWAGITALVLLWILALLWALPRLAVQLT